MTSWVLLVSFLFCLPTFAYIGNAMFWDNPINRDYLGPLCTTSVNSPGLKCYNGQDLGELAVQAGRNVVCGCTQGIAGDALCPLSDGGFTIDYFLSGGTAAGFMTGLSIFPIMHMWFYQQWLEDYVKPPERISSASYWTLVAFQVMYCLFTCTPECVFLLLHTLISISWVVILFAHWGIVAYACILAGRMQVISTGIIFVAGACCCPFMLLSYLISCETSYFLCTYGPWFFQSVLLALAFALTPALMMTSNISPSTIAKRYVAMPMLLEREGN